MSGGAPAAPAALLAVAARPPLPWWSSPAGICIGFLLPGKGLKQLYDEDQRGVQYSLLVNLLLTY